MRHATIAVALLLSAALAGSAAAKTWQQSWTVGPRPAVRIETNDGHIRVHPGPAGAASATIVYEPHRWGLVIHKAPPLVELKQDGNAISIVARLPATYMFFGVDCNRLTIDVTLPADCDLETRSGDGAVEVPGLNGRISLTTGDGHITAHGARGDLHFWTGDGGIDAEGLDGALSARSGDGHIRVTGRFDRLELRAGDGRVEATAVNGSHVTDPWDLQTGDGSILLRIPRNLSAMLDASTGDGRLRVDLPLTVRGEISHHALRGSLNGGSTPLRVHTGDGGVTLALAE